MPLAPYFQPALFGLLAAQAAVESWQRCLALAARTWKPPGMMATIVPFPSRAQSTIPFERRTAGGTLLRFEPLLQRRVR